VTVGDDAEAMARESSGMAGSAVHVAMERRERVVYKMVGREYCILTFAGSRKMQDGRWKMEDGVEVEVFGWRLGRLDLTIVTV